jgi:hypothetical protein
MFDVDGTLSLARLAAKPEMHAALAKLRSICAVAIVGGSDMKKIREQLEIPGEECESTSGRPRLGSRRERGLGSNAMLMDSDQQGRLCLWGERSGGVQTRQ